MSDAPAYDPEAVLRFYAENGIDSVEGEMPGDFFGWPEGAPKLVRPKPEPAPPPAARASAPKPKGPAPITAADAPMPTDEAMALAERVAAAATDIPSLADAIDAFEGCPLKAGARQAVVYDGIPGAPVLVMGEAPGRDEDREGKPFVGRSGQLLDRMLEAIGVSRSEGDGLLGACISNAIYWRPPGNRNPTKAEVAVCLPFMRRFVELSRPKLVLLTGNTPTQALFPDAPGITRSRGKWRTIETEAGPVPALPIFHPAFLLRQPIQKRLAWRDLLEAQAKLKEG
ncbi:uracil-DNA glycosylase family protein [Parvularcula dongshanensis]|uniref:Type-4 uracil-DNA glycosylase n=1 Tax=Parvularcula dongshanensis TaxID=1173995 RepID=A0A840I3G8_9PROT|nr:DNA polymerase [Parvularcula dongshanensis]